jgi:hypothetical protein
MIARRKTAVEDKRRHSLSPLPRDVGLTVTIGIAIKSAFGNPYIVTVTDMRVTLDDAVPGVDAGQLKELRLDEHWRFLFAADDMGYVSPIGDTARAKLSEISGRHTLAHVREAVTCAYQTVRTETIFNRYIRMYEFASMQDFIKRAASTLGSELTRDIMDDCKRFDLRVSLLVYGFDEKDEIHFIEIRNPGDPIARDNLQYWAIGSGAQMAMGALTRRTFQLLSAHVAAYRGCEAKFAAQFAYGVGEATAVIVWLRDGSVAYLDTHDCEELRKIYEDNRNPIMPTKARELIDARLKATRNPQPKPDANPASSDEKAAE